MQFMFSKSVLSLSLVLLVLSSPQSSELEEELWEAARRGDRARINVLLEQGVDVNAATRYGATALSFAADKGHVEIVKLLLERGADVNSQDTFYEATPLTWALSNGHSDVARVLLENGSVGAGQALMVSIRNNDVALAAAALATKQIDAEMLGSAMSLAEERNANEIIEILKKANVKAAPSEQPFQLSPATMRSYVGTYRNEEMDLTVEVSFENGRLIAQRPGQPPLVMTPTGENNFKVVGVDGLEVSFGGRGGMVERVVVSQARDSFVLVPIERNAQRAASVETEEKPTEEATGPAPEDLERSPQNWPSFRGPGASGIADGQGAVLEWDVASGTNIRWKTPIPGIANSSPVIWGDRIFVTTAVSSSGDSTFRTGLYGDVAPVDDLSEHSWHTYCLDKTSGKIIWDRVSYRGVPEVKRHQKASQANSTPVTDGKHVVALFGSIGGLFCYDFEGNLLWKKTLGAFDSGWFYDPDYQWGHSSSPIIYENLVIIQVDVQKNSFLAAFELDTGDEVWRTTRDEIPTWGTPTVFRSDKQDELITNGTKIRGYDPESGKLLWWLTPNSEVTVATPVIGDGIIFVTAGYPPIRPIYAIRPGSKGDITLPEVGLSSESMVWSKRSGGTYIPTPIAYGEYFYTCANNGRLTCYKAKTGERIYRARVGGSGSYSASPVAADGRLYFTSETGEVHVVKAGPQYELLATNEIGETCMATPAISAGLIVVRTLGHVYGIGK
jgi:outer membrane protein assembly factor BamB